MGIDLMINFNILLEIKGGHFCMMKTLFITLMSLSIKIVYTTTERYYTGKYLDHVLH